MVPHARTTVFDPTDPADMTAHERVDELAAILAASILRLRMRSALPTSIPHSSEDHEPA